MDRRPKIKMTPRPPSPREILLDGAKILDLVLSPKGLQFQFKGCGPSSGGDFAWGEFVRDNRWLEIHFRNSLGLVRYHIGNNSASHESYMRALGVRDQCKYPGYSDDPLEAFRDLAHDLVFADDFFTGTAAILRRAAAEEASKEAIRDAKLTAGYRGKKVS
jgi:hypothetical protein